jgi:hypothetical protein
MRRILFITLLHICLLLQSTQALYSRSAPQDRRIDERHISDFRYIIFSNEVDKRFKEHTRNVGVLMDKDAFTEDNLKKLYALISKRFSEPSWLRVWVRTSLWDIATPEEAELPNISERGFDPHDEQWPWALLIRVDDNELFRYSSEGPPYLKMKTVILKGVDPFGTKKH